MIKIAVVTINQPSLESASKLVEYLEDYDVDIYTKEGLSHTLPQVHLYNKLDDILPQAWQKYDAIIAILAMGAVVRKIAPLLQDKASDPAVIVINLALDKIVPLLSGHLGGANALADTLAQRLPNAINFISTATDQTNTLAFEMLAKKRNWKINNLKQLARISNRLLNKQRVHVYTPEAVFDSIIPKTNLVHLKESGQIDENTVVIMPQKGFEQLHFQPKVYIGMGCNRDTSLEVLEEAFLGFLEKNSLELESVASISSFEAKSDEKALLELAKKYDLPIEFFTKTQINELGGEFSPSAAQKFFNLKGVAEPSAVLASEYKTLLFAKEVCCKSVTIAGAI